MNKIDKYFFIIIDQNRSNGDNEYYQNSDILKSFILSQTRLDKYELISVLQLISKINKNHHRDINFLDKIKQIISIFQKEIIQTL